MRTRSKLVALAAGVLVTAGIAATATMASASSSEDTDCTLKADTGAVACADSEAAARAELGATSYVRGAKFWNRKGYHGATLTILVPRACSGGYDNEGAYFNFPSLGTWNDKPSSVKTYNHCDVKLFDRTRFRGADSTWVDARADLGNVGGGWNNRAASVKLS